MWQLLKSVPRVPYGEKAAWTYEVVKQWTKNVNDAGALAVKKQRLIQYAPIVIIIQPTKGVKPGLGSGQGESVRLRILFLLGLCILIRSIFSISDKIFVFACTASLHSHPRGSACTTHCNHLFLFYFFRSKLYGPLNLAGS